MRIGLDGVILSKQNAGSLRYFELFLSSLYQDAHKNDYFIFAEKAVHDSIKTPNERPFHPINVTKKSKIPAAIQQQLYRGWNSSGELDLLHSIAFVPPRKYTGKTVMTVFDLTFLRYPQTQKWTGRFWWKLLGPRGMRNTDHLIAISQSTKNDLCQLVVIEESKVSVVYPFAPDHFKPQSNREATISKYHLPDPFILYVGTLERRKNISNLLRAFALLKQDPSIQHSLVLVGQPGWLYDDIFQTLDQLNIKQDVMLLGYVPDEDLPGIYSCADLFVYLSHYEGFGFPVLEAMSCGTPVLSSNASSLPEVIGEAGITVPPGDIEQAASQMKRILTDIDLQKTLISRGFAQAALFSKERFARETLAVYEQVISSR
jgi:glycosyltransferase involved in cell wall biosynthesis